MVGVGVFCDRNISYPEPDRLEELARLRGIVITTLILGHIGTLDHPLGDFVKPGHKVLIKPNWVRNSKPDEPGYEALITNSSLIAIMVSLIQEALKGSGSVTIADAPIQGVGWDGLLQQNRIREYLKVLYNPGWLPVQILDLRAERSVFDGLGRKRKVDETPGDPLGYCPVDLKKQSALYAIGGPRVSFEVSGYGPAATIAKHEGDHNLYYISRSVLEADVVINMPKLKTHKKAGITACLKNMIGINGRKDWLPHHRRGGTDQGGDEYPGRGGYNRLERGVLDALPRLSPWLGWPVRLTGVAAKRVIRSSVNLAGTVIGEKGIPFDIKDGSWYGNDTLWRTINDLYRIVLYSDCDGSLHPKSQRTILLFIDGIVAGEREGPLEARPKPCGCLISGLDAVANDAVACWLMGFDGRKIPQVREALPEGSFPLTSATLADIAVASNLKEWNGALSALPASGFSFVPSASWAGHIERD